MAQRQIDLECIIITSGPHPNHLVIYIITNTWLTALEPPDFRGKLTKSETRPNSKLIVEDLDDENVQ